MKKNLVKTNLKYGDVPIQDADYRIDLENRLNVQISRMASNLRTTAWEMVYRLTRSWLEKKNLSA